MKVAKNSLKKRELKYYKAMQYCANASVSAAFFYQLKLDMLAI